MVLEDFSTWNEVSLSFSLILGVYECNPVFGVCLLDDHRRKGKWRRTSFGDDIRRIKAVEKDNLDS